MDDQKVDALTKVLIGTTLDGWLIRSYINRGKSAAVFAADRGNETAAVKVFDAELIERYGDDSQLARINRELELIGQKHENVVEILGGGYDKPRNLYFIIMAYVDGPNLKAALLGLPWRDRWPLIAQLGRAAQWLEQKGLVHRDIKPENIAIVDSGKRLVLLDLGVIRPIKGSDLTDADGINFFIGTLQYSSPEFLLRKEDQTEEGYRSLTFYQIGAVLHDLIMNKPIFEQFEQPYARLVMAVQDEHPIISNSEAPSYLINLAIRCLVKNPTTRIEIVKWDHFYEDPYGLEKSSPRSRVSLRLEAHRSAQEPLSKPVTKKELINKAGLTAILTTLKASARLSRAKIPGLPPLSQESVGSIDVGTCFVFGRSESIGLPHGLYISIVLEMIDAREGVIKCIGIMNNTSKVDAEKIRADGVIWYLDVYDPARIQRCFDDYFFQCLDAALQSSVANNDADCVKSIVKDDS